MSHLRTRLVLICLHFPTSPSLAETQMPRTMDPNVRNKPAKSPPKRRAGLPTWNGASLNKVGTIPLWTSTSKQHSSQAIIGPSPTPRTSPTRVVRAGGPNNGRPSSTQAGEKPKSLGIGHTRKHGSPTPEASHRQRKAQRSVCFSLRPTVEAAQGNCPYCRTARADHAHAFWQCPGRPPDKQQRTAQDALQARLGWPTSAAQPSGQLS